LSPTVESDRGYHGKPERRRHEVAPKYGIQRVAADD
jgi:hypothetical protein